MDKIAFFNDELELIIKGLRLLKTDCINDYYKPHSSMDIENRGYCREKIEKIDSLINKLLCNKEE